MKCKENLQISRPTIAFLLFCLSMTHGGTVKEILVGILTLVVLQMFFTFIESFVSCYAIYLREEEVCLLMLKVFLSLNII